MTDETVKLLKEWAKTYNTKCFIPDDPIQFPHRFTEKRDIEISAFLSAWLAYGRRTHILKKLEELHLLLGESPYQFVRGGEKTFKSIVNRDVLPNKRDTFYRFYTYQDLLALLRRLHLIYENYETLEAAVSQVKLHSTPISKLQYLFEGVPGIPVLGGTSACKRLAMFLRWMVRSDETVDFGLWKEAVQPDELIIPLDTHVHQISLKLGLTTQKNATLQAAIEITNALRLVFPGDPCLGDFALFGYDINKQKTEP